jgi:hypothetical protein
LFTWGTDKQILIKYTMDIIWGICKEEARHAIKVAHSHKPFMEALCRELV